MHSWSGTGHLNSFEHGCTAHADGLIKSPQENSRLKENNAQLDKEHKRLHEACERNITPEEKRMIYKAINLTGAGFTGQGHWYECRQCGTAYVVGAGISLLANFQMAPPQACCLSIESDTAYAY